MPEEEVKLAQYQRIGKQEHIAVFENLLTNDDDRLKDLIQQHGLPTGDEVIFKNVNMDFNSKTTTAQWVISGATIGGGHIPI